MAELAPAWAETVVVDKTEYLLCQDLAALVFMANLGCIEIHPWLSHVPELHRPDFLVLDLDPIEVDFAQVVQVAQVAREVLLEAGITGYPKTSGARGLHIYVPIQARYTYAQVTRFAEVLALLIHQRLPQITSLERLPKHRQERVYLDWLQNGEGKTMAAPYSLRAEPHAPVSTPLRWEEVTPDLHASDFNLRTIIERLAEIGDVFAPVLTEQADLAPLLRLKLAA